jgi:hypothetical protein
MTPYNRQPKLQGILSEDPSLITRKGGPLELIARLLKDSAVSQTNHTQPARPQLVVIDGLDECVELDDQTRILNEITLLITTHCVPLRFLIFSRPEARIQDAFNEGSLSRITKRISLLGGYQARQDVSLYLRDQFQRIRHSPRHRDTIIPEGWPSDDAIDLIVTKSGGYFIYPSTVIRFLGEEGYDCVERLERIVYIKNSEYDDAQPFGELDKLYLEILSSYPSARRPLLLRIFGFCLLPLLGDDWTPLDLDSITAYLNLPAGQAKQVLRGLRSLIKINSERMIIPFHASFMDFLLNKDRAQSFYLDRDEWYNNMFRDGFTATCHALGLVTNPDQRYVLLCHRGYLGADLDYSLLRHSNFWLKPPTPFNLLGTCFWQTSNQVPLITLIQNSLQQDRWSGFLLGSDEVLPFGDVAMTFDFLAHIAFFTGARVCMLS